MSRLRERFTYANVMSTLAVFLLLGGGAYAAKKKLIDTKDIAKEAVTGKKIAKSTIKSKNLKDGKGVTGADVQDGTLGGADIQDGGVAAADVADGSLPASKLAPDGAVHELGDPGEPALSNGGEGDCVWRDAKDTDIPALNPASFYEDRLGAVHLPGIVASEEINGAGDEECGATAPEPDDYLEDGVIFTLPEEFRPANSEVRLGNSLDTLIIVGVDPLVAGTDVLAPGTVYAGGAPTGILFDGIEFPVAAAAPAALRAEDDGRVERLSPEVAKAVGLK